MNKEGFNDLIGKIRTSIGEEASALNSEDFLGTIAAYNEVYDKLTYPSLKTVWTNVKDKVESYFN